MGLGLIIGVISLLLILLAVYLKTGDGNKKLSNVILLIGSLGAIVFIAILIMAILGD